MSATGRGGWGVGRSRAAQKGHRENRYDGMWIEPVEKNPTSSFPFPLCTHFLKFHNAHTLAHSPFLSPSLSPHY